MLRCTNVLWHAKWENSLIQTVDTKCTRRRKPFLPGGTFSVHQQLGRDKAVLFTPRSGRQCQMCIDISKPTWTRSYHIDIPQRWSRWTQLLPQPWQRTWGTIWCYTVDETQRWEYCEATQMVRIKHCNYISKERFHINMLISETMHYFRVHFQLSKKMIILKCINSR